MRRAFFAFAATLFLAGCPGNEPGDMSQNPPAKTTTSTQITQSPPENSTAMNPIAPQQTEIPGGQIAGSATASQDVQLTEYAIRMPETLAPGRVRFHVANAGKENHNFAIEELTIKFSSDLSRGDDGEISVVLKPGTYTVYCPVKGHREKGMERTITVR